MEVLLNKSALYSLKSIVRIEIYYGRETQNQSVGIVLAPMDKLFILPQRFYKLICGSCERIPRIGMETLRGWVNIYVKKCMWLQFHWVKVQIG